MALIGGIIYMVGQGPPPDAGEYKTPEEALRRYEELSDQIAYREAKIESIRNASIEQGRRGGLR